MRAIATVGAAGMPHVAPVGFSFIGDLDVIEVRGHTLERTKKSSDVTRTGRAGDRCGRRTACAGRGLVRRTTTLPGGGGGAAAHQTVARAPRWCRRTCANPTDSSLLAKAVRRIAATGRRIQAAGGATRTRQRDRSRSAGKRAHQIGPKFRLRTAAGRDEAPAAVRRVIGELVELAKTPAADAQRLLANARRALRRARAKAAQLRAPRWARPGGRPATRPARPRGERPDRTAGRRPAPRDPLGRRHERALVASRPQHGRTSAASRPQPGKCGWRGVELSGAGSGGLVHVWWPIRRASAR
jgi:hypothetical protein